MSTIRNVAEVAGVSLATVSRVINRSPSVLPEMVKRVEQAMNQLGYNIQGNRRLLVNQVEDTIGLIVSNFNSPFFGLLIQGVEKVARSYNRKLIVASGQYDSSMEKEALDYLLRKGCRSIVMHSKAISDEELLGLSDKIPNLVIINRHVCGMEDQCVWLENERGSYLATKYLLEKGHRRIGYINCELDIDDKTKRFYGYQKALEEKGVAVNSDWIEEAPFGEHGGAIAATNLLNKGLPVTALIAYNDFFAAAAIQVFTEHGIVVPERLSVIGFDDVLPQCYFTPKLTTIRSPIESMAMNAARLCVEGSKYQIVRQFQPLLVQRNSVMALKD